MKKILVIVAALFASLSFAGAQQMQLLPNDPAVRKGTLENGLTYYIRHNEKPAQRAEFYLATNVGALQEEPDQDGLAHFLEHMCFNGTKNFPGKGILNYLQSIGASFGGNVNASTGVEQTIYLLTNIPLINESVVDSCILVMHDYSHFVTCDPKEIDAERGVILEEKRTRNTAQWRNYIASTKYYYGDTKYANTSLIGSEDNLKNFKPESLVNFYKTWYRPDMQALIVVGDVDVDVVEAKIKSIFSDIPAAENPKQKELIRIPDNQEPVVGIITDPENSNTAMTVLWKHEARPEIINATAQGVMMDLIESIISNGMSERFEDIAAKADAPFINAMLSPDRICESTEAMFGRVACKDGDALNALGSYLYEVEKLKRYGLTDGEVERAKASLVNSYENRAKRADTRKNSEFVMPLIYNFFDSQEYMDPSAKLELVNAILPQLNAQIINTLIPQYITDENMVLVYVAPEKEGLVHPSEADFKAVINAVKAAEIAAPEGEEIASDFLDPASLKAGKVKKVKSSIYGSREWTLSNGVKVILLPTEYEKNRISVTMLQDGGRSLIETKDLPSFDDNIWSLYQSNTGIAEFPATTVSKMLSGKSVSVHPFIESRIHGVSASTTPKDLETSLQILNLCYTAPRFDADEYSQGIRQIEAVLPNLLTQSQFVLQDHMYKAFWNNERRQLISEQTLKDANLETLERVYRQLFKDAAGATAIIVGDFDYDTIKPLVEKYIGSLPKGRKAAKAIDRKEYFASGRITDDFRTPMQAPKVTVVNLYSMNEKYTVKRATDFSAVSYLLNMIYTDTLREDEGGTYGASAQGRIHQDPDQAVIQVSFDTNEEKEARLRELAVAGLKDLAENGPSDEYFERTIKYFQKLLPESRLRNSYWDSSIQDYVIYGYDYDTEREAAVNSLTKEDIKKAAADILASGNFIEIVMRPAKAE